MSTNATAASIQVTMPSGTGPMLPMPHPPSSYGCLADISAYRISESSSAFVISLSENFGIR